VTLCFAHRSMSAMAMSADAATLNGTPVTPHSAEDRGGESGACCARDAGAIGHGSGAAQRQTLVIAIRESHVSAARGEPEETIPAADPLAEAPSFLWQYRAELDRLRRPRVYPIWQSTEVVGSTSTSPTGPPLHHASPSASPPQPRRRLNASCCFPPAAAARTNGAASARRCIRQRIRIREPQTSARAPGLAARLLGPLTDWRRPEPMRLAPAEWSRWSIRHHPGKPTPGHHTHRNPKEHHPKECKNGRAAVRAAQTHRRISSSSSRRRRPCCVRLRACQPSMDGGMSPSPMEAVSEHASLHRGRRL
jgi:hypothetical protein